MNALLILAAILAVICVGLLLGRYVPHVAGSWFGEDIDYLEVMDMRAPGEAFCHDCPDHEACQTGYPCSKVKRVARESYYLAPRDSVVSIRRNLGDE